jgi:hypothetical protein
MVGIGDRCAFCRPNLQLSSDKFQNATGRVNLMLGERFTVKWQFSNGLKRILPWLGSISADKISADRNGGVV